MKLEECNIKDIEFTIVKQNISCVIFDFDYTLTLKESESSIGVFSKYLPNSYRRMKKVLDFFTKYARFKFEYIVIWKLKLYLLKKYKYKDYLKKINMENDFFMNNEIIKLLKTIHKKNINIIIYSSGMKEIIKYFLRFYHIDFDNIVIIANEIPSNKVITPKKDKLYFNNDSYCVTIGDKIDDLNVTNNSIKYLLDTVSDQIWEVKYENSKK